MLDLVDKGLIPEDIGEIPAKKNKSARENQDSR